MSQLKKGIIVLLPDTRGVEISPFGIGNTKIGFGVHTYSRIAGDSAKGNAGGTCPGSTDECERICYAKRIAGVVRQVYERNSSTNDVPELPEDCQILRIHISGDFDTLDYIASWYRRLKERPDVTAWAYTRSWRVPALLPGLEALRTLPNLQLFASMDKSHSDVPPAGWRRAWIDGDPRAGEPINVRAHEDVSVPRNLATFDGGRTFVCPEETKHKKDCLSCGYCFEGQRNDVTFLEH